MESVLCTLVHGEAEGKAFWVEWEPPGKNETNHRVPKDAFNWKCNRTGQRDLMGWETLLKNPLFWKKWNILKVSWMSD